MSIYGNNGETRALIRPCTAPENRRDQSESASGIMTHMPLFGGVHEGVESRVVRPCMVIIGVDRAPREPTTMPSMPK